MFSRYTAMRESKVAMDEKDKNPYPDPLSLNYNNTQLTSMPRRRDLGEADLRRFWIFMIKQYADIAEADDVLLTLNNIPYRGMLQPGDQLYIISKPDLYSFGTRKKPGTAR